MKSFTVFVKFLYFFLIQESQFLMDGNLDPRRQTSLGLIFFVLCIGLHRYGSFNIWVFPMVLSFSSKGRKEIKLDLVGLQLLEFQFRLNKEYFTSDTQPQGKHKIFYKQEDFQLNYSISEADIQARPLGSCPSEILFESGCPADTNRGHSGHPDLSEEKLILLVIIHLFFISLCNSTLISWDVEAEKNLRPCHSAVYPENPPEKIHTLIYLLQTLAKIK